MFGVTGALQGYRNYGSGFRNPFRVFIMLFYRPGIRALDTSFRYMGPGCWRLGIASGFGLCSK